MTLRQFARWVSAAALSSSIVWAQEPAVEGGGVPVEPASPSSSSTSTAETDAASAQAQPPARVLSGRIIDTQTKDAIPLATVTVAGTQLTAETDVDGRFTLPTVPRDTFTLQVRHQDYMRRDLSVTPDVRSVTVEVSTSYVEELVAAGRPKWRGRTWPTPSPP
jgi:hypothetical protein